VALKQLARFLSVLKQKSLGSCRRCNRNSLVLVGAETIRSVLVGAETVCLVFLGAETEITRF
jgi:hypothetical protein